MTQLRTIGPHAPALAMACDGFSHEYAERAAATDCALLLTGETGTGKGHLARWIHQHSRRAKGPFIPVNCGAIPDTLIDSHLFGHARGAFSGAGSDHLGLVRAANGGTLLLDEVSELPPTAQTRLLRLLEEREVQPVGYFSPVVVDARIIAASNVDLREAVRRGVFREDLYYRLDVVRLHLPPLRQRRHQIAGLVAQFNAEFAKVYRQAELTFDRQVMRALEQYHWPGNIRELRTTIERLHVMCGGGCLITMDDLRQFAPLRDAPTNASEHAVASGSMPDRLQALKLEVVAEALNACRGNVSRAASTLGIHRSTIYRWLNERPA